MTRSLYEPDKGNAVIKRLDGNALWLWLRERFASPGILSAEAASTQAMSPRRVINVVSRYCCGVSDTGLVRDGNEDAFFASPEHGLLIVADGLGGHAAGEIASALAAEKVRDIVTTLGADRKMSPAALLDLAFRAANQAVGDYVLNHPACSGMATTLIVALLCDERVTIGHAGDVRAYLSSSGVLRRLTNDHTSVGRLLAAGLMTEDEVRRDPARNMLLQALTGRGDLTPEFSEFDIAPGDRLLLCSDGLWDEISYGEIEEVLALPEAITDIAIRLVDRAIEAGGSDNITALVYRHEPTLSETEGIGVVPA